jgi:hypothetical protein
VLEISRRDGSSPRWHVCHGVCACLCVFDFPRGKQHRVQRVKRRGGGGSGAGGAVAVAVGWPTANDRAGGEVAISAGGDARVKRGMVHEAWYTRRCVHCRRTRTFNGVAVTSFSKLPT